MVKIIVICFVAFLIAFYVPPILYFKKGWLKRLYHDAMAWHIPKESEENIFDGCSEHNHCKFCGKEIMQDSQGNWFAC